MTLNKLRYGAINNKKIIMFLLGLCIIGIVGGSLFITIISKNDQKLIIYYMNNFITNINKINLKDAIINSLFTNMLYIISVWLLGISVIGIPIVIFMYFSKIFTLGFSISAFIITYKLKGLVLALLYVFPTQILNIGIYTLITLYSIKISNNLIYSVFNKKEINMKKIINKYIYILVICLSVSIFSLLYENIILPFILKKIILLLNI